MAKSAMAWAGRLRDELCGGGRMAESVSYSLGWEAEG